MFPDFELNNIAQSKILAIKGEKEKALALEDSSVFNYLLLNMKEEGIRSIIKVNESDDESVRYNYLDLIHHPWFEGIRDDSRFMEMVSQQKTIYEENLRKYGDVESN